MRAGGSSIANLVLPPLPFGKMTKDWCCCFCDRANCVEIFLPPWHLPVTSSMARLVFASYRNRTKANSRCWPENRSMGIKVSNTLWALQNIASNSTLEIPADRLETYRENELWLRSLIREGRGSDSTPQPMFPNAWRHFSLCFFVAKPRLYFIVCLSKSNLQRSPGLLSLNLDS